MIKVLSLNTFNPIKNNDDDTYKLFIWYNMWIVYMFQFMCSYNIPYSVFY